MRVRKRPIEVDAFPWHRTMTTEMLSFLPDRDLGYWRLANGALEINTPEGWVNCSVESFVVRGVAGEFYPVKPDIFWATFERVHTRRKKEPDND